MALRCRDCGWTFLEQDSNSYWESDLQDNMYDRPPTMVEWEVFPCPMCDSTNVYDLTYGE